MKLNVLKKSEGEFVLAGKGSNVILIHKPGCLESKKFSHNL